MDKLLGGEEIVGLQNALKGEGACILQNSLVEYSRRHFYLIGRPRSPQGHRHTHPHVLRPFQGYACSGSQQVLLSLQCLEAKVVD